MWQANCRRAFTQEPKETAEVFEDSAGMESRGHEWSYDASKGIIAKKTVNPAPNSTALIKKRLLKLFMRYAHSSCRCSPRPLLALSVCPLSLPLQAGGQPLLFRQLFDARHRTSLPTRPMSAAAGPADRFGFRAARHAISPSIRELASSCWPASHIHAHADHVTGSWLMHAATAAPTRFGPPARGEHAEPACTPGGSGGLRKAA